MLIKLNGTEREIPDGWTVGRLLAHFNVPAAGTAVELNGVILTKGERENRPLHPGDTLEIVRLIGGG